MLLVASGSGSAARGGWNIAGRIRALTNTLPARRVYQDEVTNEVTTLSIDAILSSPTLPATDDRLGDLFDLHHQRLYRLARRLSGSAEEAHDLVQESFLRAARSIHRVPSTARGAEAWLVRTLVNLCRDGYRRAQVRRRAAATVLAVAPAAVEPEERLVARAAVRDALASLDARRRAVVVLHELEDRPMREVARLLGIAPVTARWHLSKARRQLAVLLASAAEEIAT